MVSFSDGYSNPRNGRELELCVCFFIASCNYMLLVYITYVIFTWWWGGGAFLSGRSVIKLGIWSVMHLLTFIYGPLLPYWESLTEEGALKYL